MIESNIPLKPSICTLGIYPKDFTRTTNAKEIRMIDFGLGLHARRMIALSWKNTEPPSFGVWKRELMSGLGLEKLSYMIRGRQEEFIDVWDAFISFLANKSWLTD